MSYGLPPPPRAITPDTALPSIERETRPAPAPFSFTGEERRHVPFDFRPPGLAAPFQPQYNTRSGHHHPAGSAHGPIELFEDPLVEHNKRMQPPPLPPPPQHPPPPPPYRPHYSSQAEHFPSQTPWQPFTYGQPPPPHPEHWRPVAPRLQDHRSPKDPR
jgi:hypothetical protein